MRVALYLKISLLPLYLSIIGQLVQGAAISHYANNVASRILRAKSLPFEDCGSKYLILYLNVSSCTAIPCVMKRGSTVNVTVLFNDGSDNTSFLRHRVRWIFNFIKTQASISPDPCDGVHNCLSSDSEGKFYSATVLVNNFLPAIAGSMLWEAINERDEDVICFKIPVVVTM